VCVSLNVINCKNKLYTYNEWVESFKTKKEGKSIFQCQYILYFHQHKLYKLDVIYLVHFHNVVRSKKV